MFDLLTIAQILNFNLTVIAWCDVAESSLHACFVLTTIAHRFGIIERIVESIIRKLKPPGVDAVLLTRMRKVDGEGATEGFSVELENFVLLYIAREHCAVV